LICRGQFGLGGERHDADYSVFLLNNVSSG